MLTFLKNCVQKVIFPCPPTIEERTGEQLAEAKNALHLLELQHLDTILANEHYFSYKTELVARIERLTNAINPPA